MVTTISFTRIPIPNPRHILSFHQHHLQLHWLADWLTCEPPSPSSTTAQHPNPTSHPGIGSVHFWFFAVSSLHWTSSFFLTACDCVPCCRCLLPRRMFPGPPHISVDSTTHGLNPQQKKQERFCHLLIQFIISISHFIYIWWWYGGQFKSLVITGRSRFARINKSCKKFSFVLMVFSFVHL